MPKTNALYGYGGFGREVMPILKTYTLMIEIFS